MRERKWNSILAFPLFKGRSLSAAVSKWVMGLVCHFDQEERETGGAVRWKTMIPKLMRAFGHKGHDIFWRMIGLNTFLKEANRRGLSSARIHPNSSVYIRANQGHTGGFLIAPELMGLVIVPCNWQEFVFHGGCPFNINSILDTGLINGGRARREDKPFSSHLSSENDDVQLKKERESWGLQWESWGWNVNWSQSSSSPSSTWRRPHEGQEPQEPQKWQVQQGWQE